MRKGERRCANPVLLYTGWACNVRGFCICGGFWLTVAYMCNVSPQYAAWALSLHWTMEHSVPQGFPRELALLRTKRELTRRALRLTHRLEAW